MTHGCGSLSTTSVGCSGFSGSTFNATSAAIIAASASRTSRNRRTNVGQRDEDCVVDSCACCFTGISALFGLLFCARKMTRQTRIMLTWFWVLLFSVSCCLIVGVGLYGAQEFAAAESDMRIVDKSYSTFICDSFMVEPSHSSNIYLMPEIPPINKRRRQPYNKTANMVVSGGTYEYWGFYFLEGSSVTVRSCAMGYSTFYVIRGRQNLDDWISDNSCSSCVIYRRTLPRSILCGGPIGAYVKYELKLLSSDDIYFVYAVSSFYPSANIYARFQLEKTSYDVSSALQVHRDALSGFFELAYETPEVIIYEIVPGFGQDLTVSIKTQCYPRIILYMAFFVLPPLIAGLLVTFLIWKKCKNPGQVSTERQTGRAQLLNQGPRTPLLSAQYTSEYVTQQQPGATTPATLPVYQEQELPPKYETVEHTKNAPPSYEDSLTTSR